MSWKKKFVRNWGRLGMKFNTMKMEDALDALIDYRGKTPKKSKTGIITLSAKSVKNNHIDYSQCYFISEEEYEKFMVRGFPKKGDILLTTEAPLGLVARLDRNDVAIAQRLLTLRGKENVLDNDYLLYYLQSPIGQASLKARETGTTVTGIKQAEFRKIEIEIPDYEVQKKVSGILRIIDQKIELNNAINNNLLQQALAVYKAWFCDYVLSDGVLPESWHITTIDALSSLVTRGIAPKYDDSSNQIVLNQKCIRDHTIDVSLARRHLQKRINEKWISKGDLLINSTGTGTLGRVAQVWFDTNNMTVDSHVTIVRPKAPILQSYIGFWGLSHESEIEAQHTGSTGQTELPRDRVKALELLLPDEDTLIKFNGLVIPMTDIVVSNQKENARLSQLRDTLLPKLMSGELDVSNIEI